MKPPKRKNFSLVFAKLLWEKAHLCVPRDQDDIFPKAHFFPIRDEKFMPFRCSVGGQGACSNIFLWKRDFIQRCFSNMLKDVCLPLNSDDNAPNYGGTCWNAWGSAEDVKLWAADNCGENTCTWPQINSKVIALFSKLMRRFRCLAFFALNFQICFWILKNKNRHQTHFFLLIWTKYHFLWIVHWGLLLEPVPKSDRYQRLASWLRRMGGELPLKTRKWETRLHWSCPIPRMQRWRRVSFQTLRRMVRRWSERLRL